MSIIRKEGYNLIHTAKFYIEIEEIELGLLCRKFKEHVTMLAKKIDSNFKGITTTITNRFNQWWIFINIDFIEILGKSDITKKDNNEIIKKINQYLFSIFGENDKELTLIRIDYRLDAVVENSEHRSLLIKLYKKSIEHYGFKKKYDQFDTTVYFNSKSIQVIVYDKECERTAHLKDIKPYEEDVLRFEVRLTNRHLNYMKKACGLPKKLEYYLDNNFWLKYMKLNLLPAFFNGSFYKINIATKIIEQSSFKERDKTRLREFLCDISKHGFERLKVLTVTTSNGNHKIKYSKYLIKKFIKMLEVLDINPLLIPKNYKLNLGKRKCIKNPFSHL
ncbi:phage/plasmid replication protein [Heyndrickxia oleronia]|uniref:phage/plasmid replication domain-containing protein n=1 Tax=Heyndrickxia oleronia TaxID=38875 RepID=UPI003F1E8B6E